MARPALQDFLQNYAFWLMDVAPVDSLALPIFSPLFGFSAITAPEITLEMETIQEGNWPYARKVIKSGNVSPMTLSRGVTYFDSDFYRWIVSAAMGDPEALQSRGFALSTALTADNDNNDAAAYAAINLGLLGLPRIGGPSPRRDMLLIQFFAHAPAEPDVILGRIAVEGAISEFIGMTPLLSAGIVEGLTFGGGKGLSKLSSRVPARAWKLKGCIPVRYKAASDFEGTSSDISIMELDMEVEEVEEISLAA